MFYDFAKNGRQTEPGGQPLSLNEWPLISFSQSRQEGTIWHVMSRLIFSVAYIFLSLNKIHLYILHPGYFKAFQTCDLAGELCC